MERSTGHSGFSMSRGARARFACGALLLATCGFGLSSTLNAQRSDTTRSRSVKAASQTHAPAVFHTRNGRTASVLRRVPGGVVLSVSDGRNRAIGVVTVIAPAAVELEWGDVKGWISKIGDICGDIKDLADDVVSDEDGNATGGSTRTPRVECTATVEKDGRFSMSCKQVT